MHETQKKESIEDNARRRRSTQTQQCWWYPKTYRGEEKYTQRRETTTERSEQMHKKCIRDKKRLKRQQDIQRILEDFKRCQQHPRNQNCKKESAHHKDKE